MVALSRQLAVPQHLAEPRQIRQFRRSSYAPGRFGCPIGFKQDRQIPATPQRCPYNREQALEAMFPSVDERKAAHEKMDQKPHPDLPPNGVGAVAEEVGELKRLLDLLEEHLDIPAAAVEFSDRPRAPLQVVGHEDHLNILSVDLDEGNDAAQFARIRLLRSFKRHLDHLVAQDTLVPSGVESPNHIVLHVVLRPADPPNAALGQLEEMLELRVGLIKHGDFTGFEPSTKLYRLCAVMMLGRVDDSALRKEALQVKTQMALRSGLSSSVLSPVHAVGNQLDRGRIHRINSLTEAAQVSPAYLALRKARNRIHQVLHHTPVKLFGHVGISNLVGMTEVVARWRNGSADRGKRGRVHLKRIAYIIKAKRMGEVSVQQRNRVAPRCVRPAVGIDSMLLCKVRDHVARNQIAHLLQGCIPMTGWLVLVSLCFHTLRVEDSERTSQLFL